MILMPPLGQFSSPTDRSTISMRSPSRSRSPQGSSHLSYFEHVGGWWSSTGGLPPPANAVAGTANIMPAVTARVVSPLTGTSCWDGVVGAPPTHPRQGALL